MTISHPIKSGESGFTLIELSIVLVIIGLIVGGILTGQDLIKAAEQRATLAQIEKYNTAVNTFRNKFGYIPGDMPFATVNSFGIGINGGTMTAGGDGNGLLQDGQATNGDAPTGEILLFWSQLSQAGLIDGSLGNATADVSLAGVGVSGTTSKTFPLAKLGRGNYIVVGSDNTNGFNAYALGGIPATYTIGASAVATYTAGTNNLNPLESYSMDKKVDDGMPLTGTVQARTAKGYAAAPQTAAMSMIQPAGATNKPVWSSAGAPASGDCVTTGASGTDTTDTYAVGTSNNTGTSPACALRFRFN